MWDNFKTESLKALVNTLMAPRFMAKFATQFKFAQTEAITSWLKPKLGFRQLSKFTGVGTAKRLTQPSISIKISGNPCLYVGRSYWLD